MKILVWTIASLLASLVASAREGPRAAAPENSPGAHFPSVKAAKLEKRELSLPADFEGDRNLLLVAFERDQQKDVVTWLRELKRFEELEPRFHYYESPTTQRPPAFTRWLIDTGLRHGIPDRKERERTISLYLDKKPFCDALLISDQEKIHQFLVDRNGRVLWRSEGLFDETRGASLRSALGEKKHG